MKTGTKKRGTEQKSRGTGERTSSGLHTSAQTPPLHAVDLSKYHRILNALTPVVCQGQVANVVGLTVEVEGLAAQIGELCRIFPGAGSPPVPAEVVGFHGRRLRVMPLGRTDGIQPGSEVVASGDFLTVPVGEALLGRVLDGLGQPIDGEGPVLGGQTRPVYSTPPHPLGRQPIREPLTTGVRAIDGVLTCGKGQRIGLFAGSGVGKSTLMGCIARSALADVSVVALIGERGREVQEFLERDLGPEGLERAVVVVSTSDQPPLVRLKGALVATTIAESFRDKGADVVFLMDSVTRFAMAQREVGLAAGEPPTTKGYPPSVFALLPRLMERTGTSESGSITGFYTVLVEADDFNEPISDTVRSILDGHIMLSRELAAEGHYPAIDVLDSISRVMPVVAEPDQLKLAGQLRDVLATYDRAADLINIGAYESGSNPNIDYALRVRPRALEFLRQPPDEFTPYAETLERLQTIFGEAGD
ncbi:MAG: putative ATP synthase YscN [Anaerolineales bacterium]|nr:putative ATP synthase YscN [Anaerolineales bacterium]